MHGCFQFEQLAADARIWTQDMAVHLPPPRVLERNGGRTTQAILDAEAIRRHTRPRLVHQAAEHVVDRPMVRANQQGSKEESQTHGC